MDFMEYFCIACAIGVLVLMTILKVKDVKKYRRTPPDGKVFIKTFYDTITDIYLGQTRVKTEYFTSTVNGITFNVNVKKDETPAGLKYETIPLHKSYCAYINNEAVCRVHILQVNCKDKIYLDFSAKRKCTEIVEIIEGALPAAKAANKQYYKDTGFYSDKTSFYSVEDK